jgi:hypothetical protein
LPWAVAEDREGLLQARQVDGADQHRGLAAVASDRHPPGTPEWATSRLPPTQRRVPVEVRPWRGLQSSELCGRIAK